MLYLVMEMQALKPDLKHLLGLHLKQGFKYVKGKNQKSIKLNGTFG